MIAHIGLVCRDAACAQYAAGGLNCPLGVGDVLQCRWDPVIFLK
jgi:hypothetical protein